MPPRVSFVIPTLNSAATLAVCLEAIGSQDYPREKTEVVVADAGSSDETLKIVEHFRSAHGDIKTRVVANPLKTGEAGKAAALRQAMGDVVAFVDSDNILEDTGWLRRMVTPFDDAEVIAAEPIRYTYRRKDPWITRYCALMGMNDPLCYFLGNFDRTNILSSRWTCMPYKVLRETDDYLKVALDPARLPTIGANGFLIRREAMAPWQDEEYLFDIDILAALLAGNARAAVAKVKVGIVHLYCATVGDFWRKQRRRVADYRYFSGTRRRRYGWEDQNRGGMVYFCLSCGIVLPLLLQALRGWWRSRDRCMAGHPVLCLATCLAYATGMLGPARPAARHAWQRIKR